MKDQLAGRKIGFWIVEDLLGEGTFGKVYRGRDQSIEESLVAIKVLKPQWSRDPAFVASLRAECKALMELRHPHIVQFIGASLDEEPRCMVMEFLEGRSLDDRLKEGPFTPQQVESFLAQALDALAFAHDRGIIHRDIKPANIYLCRAPSQDHVKLVDFGLAKSVVEAGGSYTTDFKGTPAYAPKEQWKARSVAASDVYAIGVVAWEMLTGDRACPHHTLTSIYDWVMTASVQPVGPLCPECPPWLARFVDSLCRKEERERPSNGGEALREFQEARRRANQPLPPPSRRGLWATLAVAGVGLLGAGAWAWTRSTSAPVVEPPMSAPAETVELRPAVVQVEPVRNEEPEPVVPQAAPVPPPAPPARPPDSKAPPLAQTVVSPPPLQEPVSLSQPLPDAPCVRPAGVATPVQASAWCRNQGKRLAASGCPLVLTDGFRVSGSRVSDNTPLSPSTRFRCE